jgi:hypothetical protein
VDCLIEIDLVLRIEEQNARLASWKVISSKYLHPDLVVIVDRYKVSDTHLLLHFAHL